jgi:hypothetical protein
MDAALAQGNGMGFDQETTTVATDSQTSLTTGV